jgi:sensor c-di-GMP phosphodiesterase-like protein
MTQQHDPERREHWPKDNDFFTRLERHMIAEELRENAENDKFSAGEKRMEQIERDLRPLRSMYHAVIGSGGVAALLLATVLFIYNNDREQTKELQQAIYRQGVAIERLILSHAELERDYRRDIERVEKAVKK